MNEFKELHTVQKDGKPIARVVLCEESQQISIQHFNSDSSSWIGTGNSYGATRTTFIALVKALNHGVIDFYDSLSENEIFNK